MYCAEYRTFECRANISDSFPYYLKQILNLIINFSGTFLVVSITRIKKTINIFVNMTQLYFLANSSE